MNLVVDCMQVFSGRPLSYFRGREKELLLELLRRSFKNPAVAPFRKDLREILDYVEVHNERRNLWRDCEIYYPIEMLTESSQSQYFPYFIEMLRVFAGLKGPEALRHLPDGFYRLRNLHEKVYEVRSGRQHACDVLLKLPDFKGDVYLPRNGLFTDILVEQFYPSMKGSRSKASFKKQMSRTFDHMRDFSGDLWEDFQDATRTIVLLTNSRRAGTISLAFCYKYFGGIFFNPFRNDEFRGVEQLVHEYTHNRITLWWETQRPTGIPHDSVTIISPVTGARIPASIMIHAFIVYLSALQFYRWAQSKRLASDRGTAKTLNARAEHISANMPELRRRLKKTVRRGTGMDRLLEYLWEVYEPLKEVSV